jgi:hypothetical protein
MYPLKPSIMLQGGLHASPASSGSISRTNRQVGTTRYAFVHNTLTLCSKIRCMSKHVVFTASMRSLIFKDCSEGKLLPWAIRIAHVDHLFKSS